MILLDFEWAISPNINHECNYFVCNHRSFHICKRFPFKNSCIKLDFDSSDMNNVRLKVHADLCLLLWRKFEFSGKLTPICNLTVPQFLTLKVKMA